MANYAHMWPIALSISQLHAQLFVRINNCTPGKQRPSFQIFLLGEADGVIVALEMDVVATGRESDTRSRLSGQSLQTVPSAKESGKNHGTAQGQGKL